MKTVRVAGAVARHPSLWRTAIVQGGRLVPRRWWSRRPFVPVPDRAYLRFRLETQYGDSSHPMASGDVVTWLRWCKAFDQSCRQPATADR